LQVKKESKPAREPTLQKKKKKSIIQDLSIETTTVLDFN
jgi:hypothetical protein